MHIRQIPLSLTSAAVAVAMTCLATPAFAQDPTPPSEPPPATHHRTSSGVGAGGGGLGLGIAMFTSGLVGPNVVYDFGQFHVEGLFAFQREGAPAATVFDIGAGGWYHLNVGDASDFSLGGTLGFVHNTAGAGNTSVLFEPGAMLRAFVTSNVALHGRLGLVFVFQDGPDAIALTGQPVGGFGATYFWR